MWLPLQTPTINKASTQYPGLVFCYPGWAMERLGAVDGLGCSAGSISGAPQLIEVPGHGRAFRFDGTDDVVSFNHCSHLSINHHYTVMAWFRRHSAGMQYPSIIGKFEDTKGFGLIAAAERVVGHLGYGPAWIFDNSSNSPAAGYYANQHEVHHYASRFNGINLASFVDGRHYSSYPVTESPSLTSANVLMGRHYSQTGAGWWLAGDVWDARIYGRALTDGEIYRAFSTPQELYGTWGAVIPRWLTAPDSMESFLSSQDSLTATDLAILAASLQQQDSVEIDPERAARNVTFDDPTKLPPRLRNWRQLLRRPYSKA